MATSPSLILLFEFSQFSVCTKKITAVLVQAYLRGFRDLFGGKLLRKLLGDYFRSHSESYFEVTSGAIRRLLRRPIGGLSKGLPKRLLEKLPNRQPEALQVAPEVALGVNARSKSLR